MQSLTVCSMTIGTRLAEGESVHFPRDSAKEKATKGYCDRTDFLRAERDTEWRREHNMTREPRRAEKVEACDEHVNNSQFWTRWKNRYLPFSSLIYNLMLRRWQWTEDSKQPDPPRHPWILSGQIGQVASLSGQARERTQIHHVNVSPSHEQCSTSTQACLGPIDEVNSPQPVFGTLQTPVFGSNHTQNIPFIFQSPEPPSTSQSYPWTPDSMKMSPKEEFKDVDMGETSPLKVDVDSDEKENGRQIALGALKRVYGRRRRRRMSKSSRSRPKLADKDEGLDSGSDMDDRITPITQNTANHYTVNMPVPISVSSETPYVLLG